MKKLFLLAALLCAALCLAACSGWELSIKHPNDEQSGALSENSELEQSGEENKTPEQSEGGIYECTNEETLAFAKTEAAAEQITFWAKKLGDREFESISEIDDASKFSIFIEMGQKLQSEVGEEAVTDDGFFYAVLTSVMDKYMFKYMGVTDYDRTAYLHYDEENGIFKMPTAWDCWDPEIYLLEPCSVTDNFVTYRCVFNMGLNDGEETPYQFSFITVEALKDNDETFYRIISVQNLSGPFDSYDEAFERSFEVIGSGRDEGEAPVLPEVSVTFDGKAEFEDFSFSMLKSSTMYDWTWERGWVQDGNIIYDEDGNEYIIFAGTLEISDESKPFSEADKLFSEATVIRELSFNGFPCQLYVTKEPIEGLGLSKTTYNYCILSGGSLYRIELYPTMGRGGFDVQVDPFEKCLETIEFK